MTTCIPVLSDEKLKILRNLNSVNHSCSQNIGPAHQFLLRGSISLPLKKVLIEKLYNSYYLPFPE